MSTLGLSLSLISRISWTIVYISSMTLFAICKCIGTLTPTILFGIILENNLVLILGSFCFIFDSIYIFLVLKYKSTAKLLNK